MTPPPVVRPQPLLNGRYELLDPLPGRHGLDRFRAADHGRPGGPVPVAVVRAPAPPPAGPAAAAPPLPEDVVDLTGGGDAWTPSASATTIRLLDWKPPPWPGLDWEQVLLEHASHPGLPRPLDRFVAGGFDYLVEDAAEGVPLWDAWDDPAATVERRFGWLVEAGEVAQALYRAGAVPEALRPEQLVVTPAGRVVLADLSELLPLTQAEGVPPAGRSFYTAPELVLGRRPIDPRCVLYSLGAVIYALHVGPGEVAREAGRVGLPEPFLERFPDAHPALARLVGKTFYPDPLGRFPSEEAHWFDPSGFTELLQGLQTCRSALARVRLEVAGWTTTGMVRSGNEDAFAVLASSEARQDGLDESALILLADGMGGAEAGEVAAALAVQCLRQHLLNLPPLARLQSITLPPASAAAPAEDAVVEAVRSALIDANKCVYESAQCGQGRRGMGCTAEVVVADGKRLVVGHVGDSRTYRLHRGRLELLTRDQTLVARLVEMGQLTEEEAEFHPRRAELQQAVGGRPYLDPEVVTAPLEPGDWVLVCSDGLTNTLKPAILREVLERAPTAESAARRLVNLANACGSADNVTVAVLRAV